MPRTHEIHTFEMIAHRGWVFEPQPWLWEIFGDRETIEMQTAAGIACSYSSIGEHNGRVLAVAGLTLGRCWQGRCVEAMAWSIPCVGLEEHARFCALWGRGVPKLQASLGIQRVEAFVLWPCGSYVKWATRSDKQRAFLEALGFTHEGVRENYLPGINASCMVRQLPASAALQKLH